MVGQGSELWHQQGGTVASLRRRCQRAAVPTRLAPSQGPRASPCTWRDAGEVWARCGRGVGEVWARCRDKVWGRGVGELWGRDVGEVHFLSFSSFSSFFLSRSSGFFDFLRSFHTCTHRERERTRSAAAALEFSARPANTEAQLGHGPSVYLVLALALALVRVRVRLQLLLAPARTRTPREATAYSLAHSLTPLHSPTPPTHSRHLLVLVLA